MVGSCRAQKSLTLNRDFFRYQTETFRWAPTLRADLPAVRKRVAPSDPAVGTVPIGSAVIDLVGDRAELTNCPMPRPVPAFPAPPRTHCPSGESSLRVEGFFFQKLFISSRDYGCVHRTPGPCRTVAFAMRELVTGPRGIIIRSTSLNAGREQMLVRDVARGAAASTAA